MRNKKEPKFKVVEWGCRECTSHCRDDRGYVRIYVNWKHYRMHRYMYEQKNWPIPAGLVLRHKCDNPRCCNPDHLEVGTRKDNWEDMRLRGNPFGWKWKQWRPWQAPWNAKLSEKEVVEIFKSPLSQRALAKKYGLNRHTVFNIKNKISWKRVTKDL